VRKLFFVILLLLTTQFARSQCCDVCCHCNSDWYGEWDAHPCDGLGCASPIIINLDGAHYELTDAAHGVQFDMSGKGTPIQIAWTSPEANEAFLVLDRNGNGTIDYGSELFGNFTPQPQGQSRNGFVALAVFDSPENGGNRDGRIDSNDAVFHNLRLWIDANHNGISEPKELFTLEQRGVEAISLDYKDSRRVDR
jgi:hypothetical protein